MDPLPAASYREGTIWVWDPRTGKSICGWENNFMANLALSPDGKRLTLDAIQAGSVIRTMNPRVGEFPGASVHNPGRSTQLAFSPDGNVLFAQGGQHSYILDGVTGVEQRHIEVDAGKQDIRLLPSCCCPTASPA